MADFSYAQDGALWSLVGLCVGYVLGYGERKREEHRSRSRARRR